MQAAILKKKESLGLVNPFQPYYVMESPKHTSFLH